MFSGTQAGVHVRNTRAQSCRGTETPTSSAAFTARKNRPISTHLPKLLKVLLHVLHRRVRRQPAHKYLLCSRDHLEKRRGERETQSVRFQRHHEQGGLSTINLCLSNVHYSLHAEVHGQPGTVQVSERGLNTRTQLNSTPGLNSGFGVWGTGVEQDAQNNTLRKVPSESPRFCLR